MGRLATKALARLSIVVAAGAMLSLYVGPAAAQDHCGAIAISQKTGRLGWSYDFKSRSEAESAAQRECAKSAQDCTVPVWFCNACGAVATTPDLGFGSGWGTTRELAEQYAIQSCQQYNPGKQCSIQRWVCTTR